MRGKMFALGANEWEVGYSEEAVCALKRHFLQDFPGDPVGKNLPTKAGDMGSIPGRGRSHRPQSS